MSLETWKEEFYPVSVGEAALTFDKDTPHGKLALIDHAIKKWEGLRPSSLAEHELGKLGKSLHSQHEVFGIDSFSCSLCEVYASKCSKCPLQACQPEFNAWLDSPSDKSNPEPMLALLQRVRGEVSATLAPVKAAPEPEPEPEPWPTVEVNGVTINAPIKALIPGQDAYYFVHTVVRVIKISPAEVQFDALMRDGLIYATEQDAKDAYEAMTRPLRTYIPWSARPLRR